MDTTVIGPDQYGELKRNALRRALLQKYEHQLANGSKAEKMRILKAIEAEMEAANQEDLKKWTPDSGLGGIGALPKVGTFAVVIVLLFLAASIAAILWVDGRF